MKNKFFEKTLPTLIEPSYFIRGQKISKGNNSELTIKIYFYLQFITIFEKKFKELLLKNCF